MAFLPLAKTHLLCFWQFGFITDYDRVVDDILQVENKILPIVHLILKLTKIHPLCNTFCQKHSGCIFASGKNGSIPNYSGDNFTPPSFVVITNLIKEKKVLPVLQIFLCHTACPQ